MWLKSLPDKRLRFFLNGCFVAPLLTTALHCSTRKLTGCITAADGGGNSSFQKASTLFGAVVPLIQPRERDCLWCHTMTALSLFPWMQVIIMWGVLELLIGVIYLCQFYVTLFQNTWSFLQCILTTSLFRCLYLYIYFGSLTLCSFPSGHNRSSKINVNTINKGPRTKKETLPKKVFILIR